MADFKHTPESKLRQQIYRHYANAEIDGRILVENMELVFKWITNGEVPAKQSGRGKHLKPVDNEQKGQ